MLNGYLLPIRRLVRILQRCRVGAGDPRVKSSLGSEPRPLNLDDSIAHRAVSRHLRRGDHPLRCDLMRNTPTHLTSPRPSVIGTPFGFEGSYGIRVMRRTDPGDLSGDSLGGHPLTLPGLTTPASSVAPPSDSDFCTLEALRNCRPVSGPRARRSFLVWFSLYRLRCKPPCWNDILR